MHIYNPKSVVLSNVITREKNGKIYKSILGYFELFMRIKYVCNQLRTWPDGKINQYYQLNEMLYKHSF